jgi:hypothetical protein
MLGQQLGHREQCNLLLSVKDWAKLYECNRTRSLKRMHWLSLPTDQATDGYTELIAHERGLSHFGAFVAILQLAARCEPRGTLVRANGQAHTPESIARIVRTDQILIAEAIERLLAIGWLEIDVTQDGAGIPQAGANLPQASAESEQVGADQSAPTRHGNAGKSPNRQTLQTNKQTHTAALQFVEAYPRKTGTQIGIQTYLSLIDDGEKSAVLAGLDRWKNSEAWKKDGGKWIPEPARWLTDRRWQEYPAPAHPAGGYETPPFKESFS